MERFDYVEEPSHAWTESLARLREAGVEAILTHVPWGAHEVMKGTRDFSKASRLRLEKFLSAAQTVGLGVELLLGFPASRESFPVWAYDLPKKAWIPTPLWDRESGRVALTEIPSLFEEELESGFFSFLEEVLTIAALYRGSGGPISRIRLDLGIYESDQNAMENPRYLLALSRRYRSVADMNLRYQTSFSQFTPVASRQGFRALTDKRAWLAAFDYKWCRQQMLSDLRTRLKTLPTVRPVADLLRESEEREAVVPDSSWSVLIDGALAETAPDGSWYAFTPAGCITPASVTAFRLGEYLGHHCRASGHDWQVVPVVGATVRFPGRLLVVISGKYLSSSALEAIRDWIQGGGHVLLPAAVPRYDEEMRSHELMLNPEHRQLGAIPFLRAGKGKGAVWSPLRHLEPSETLWKDLETLAEAVLSEVEAA